MTPAARAAGPAGPAHPGGAARAAVAAEVRGLARAMGQLLRESIRHPSVSGSEGNFTRFIAAWAMRAGFDVDAWQADEASVSAYPQGQARHLPLADRPTLVVRLPGRTGRPVMAAGGVPGRSPSLIFNAHADVVAAPQPQRWASGPWEGATRDGRMYGRGACDVKGGLVSALWAMTAVKAAVPDGLAGDVLLELVPGEEDCVGLGTLTSVLRGHHADAAVVLEPTDHLPRCASRGGLRFEIVCAGKAVHGTVKWLGVDAIALLRRVLDALAELERAWNERDADPLFAPYPLARPVTVDRVEGGDWQGMIADRCLCAGYLELLPGDDLARWKGRFVEHLYERLVGLGEPAGEVRRRIEVRFPEEYAGHRTAPDHPLCAAAGRIAAARPGTAWAGWTAFNSGCEAGLRAALHGTPTLVWGPGSLAHAHAIDEFVALDDVKAVAEDFAALILAWSGGE